MIPLFSLGGGDRKCNKAGWWEDPASKVLTSKPEDPVPSPGPRKKVGWTGIVLRLRR